VRPIASEGRRDRFGLFPPSMVESTGSRRCWRARERYRSGRIRSSGGSYHVATMRSEAFKVRCHQGELIMRIGERSLRWSSPHFSCVSLTGRSRYGKRKRTSNSSTPLAVRDPEMVERVRERPDCLMRRLCFRMPDDAESMLEPHFSILANRKRSHLMCL
jgi:hypothetical protein